MKSRTRLRTPTSIPTNLLTAPYNKPVTYLAGTSQALLSFANNSLSSTNSLVIDWDQNTAAFRVLNNNSTVIIASANNSAPAGSWYEVVYSFDGTTNKLYVNSVLASTTVTAHGTGNTNFLQPGRMNG